MNARPRKAGACLQAIRHTVRRLTPSIACKQAPTFRRKNVFGWFYLTGALACALMAAEPPLPAAERAKLITDLEARRASLDAALAQSPKDLALLSRRGDCHLFLGRFTDAIADFEKMIALDPAQDAP